MKLASIVFAMVLAATAASVARTMYVRARNTHVMQAPDVSAKTVAVLQPGAEVGYVGPAEKAPGWHQVAVQAARGFVYQSNLSVTKPSLAIGDSSAPRPHDGQASPTFGAVIPGLGPGAIRYGTQTETQFARAVDDIRNAEAISVGITDAELAKHAIANHLHPMVGPMEAAQ